MILFYHLYKLQLTSLPSNPEKCIKLRAATTGFKCARQLHRDSRRSFCLFSRMELFCYLTYQ